MWAIAAHKVVQVKGNVHALGNKKKGVNLLQQSK
jgi:hypothetical protein